MLYIDIFTFSLAVVQVINMSSQVSATAKFLLLIGFVKCSNKALRRRKIPNLIQQKYRKAHTRK